MSGRSTDQNGEAVDVGAPGLGLLVVTYASVALVVGVVGGVLGPFIYNWRYCGSPSANCGIEAITWAVPGGVVGLGLAVAVFALLESRLHWKRMQRA